MSKEDLKTGLILGLLCCLCMTFYAWKATDEVLAFRRNQNASNELRIKELEAELEETQNELEEAKEDVSGTLLPGQFKITYYWPGEDQYGDSIARPCDGKHKAIEGHTAAVDPTVIPYGTRFRIGDDPTIYTAEDCGSAVKGNVVDVFVEKPRQEMYYDEIYIYEE